MKRLTRAVALSLLASAVFATRGYAAAEVASCSRTLIEQRDPALSHLGVAQFISQALLGLKEGKLTETGAKRRYLWLSGAAAESLHNELVRSPKTVKTVERRTDGSLHFVHSKNGTLSCELSYHAGEMTARHCAVDLTL
jgi:hypothetical protein